MGIVKNTRLGKVQLEIMQVLWSSGPSTARQITDALNARNPIAHSTVQTLLRKMEAKGVVTHDSGVRIFVFRALCKEEEVNETAFRDVLTRLFAGSVTDLVAHLLKHEKITNAELMELRRLVDAAESEAVQ